MNNFEDLEDSIRKCIQYAIGMGCEISPQGYYGVHSEKKVCIVGAMNIAPKFLQPFIIQDEFEEGLIELEAGFGGWWDKDLKFPELHAIGKKMNKEFVKIKENNV